MHLPMELHRNTQHHLLSESFIPSTVKLWNRLDQFDRNLDTLTKFKKAIRKEQSDNNGIKDSVVIESLQKGIIKSVPFLKG
jgi:hypothetical protein